ncbi:hypothetical protein EWI61_02950 [Methylolobus aquaticus]|nr:hypothetical protein EWI61_02950 [Methylolobus aquaticus]
MSMMKATYSESLFKTLKYRPDYPAKPFAELADARRWVEHLAHWYNHEHRHSALRFVTPAQRHAGLDAPLLAQRKAVYEAARRRHPKIGVSSLFANDAPMGYSSWQ